jgi:hypothetical protein
MWIYILSAPTNERVQAVIRFPRQNWRILAFDLARFIFLGFFLVSIVIEPKSSKEAFLAGATWEATALALLSTVGGRRKLPKAKPASTKSDSKRGKTAEFGRKTPAELTLRVAQGFSPILPKGETGSSGSACIATDDANTLGINHTASPLHTSADNAKPHDEPT